MATKKKSSPANKKKAAPPNAQPEAKRPAVVARTPLQTLTQLCATNANRTKGEIQQEWFALGSYILQFRQQTVMPMQSGSEQQAPLKSMAAGAGGH